METIPDNWREMKDEDKIAHLDKMEKEHDVMIASLEEEPVDRMEELKKQEYDINEKLSKLEDDDNGN